MGVVQGEDGETGRDDEELDKGREDESEWGGSPGSSHHLERGLPVGIVDVGRKMREVGSKFASLSPDAH
jgi:hypothetical protein